MNLFDPLVEIASDLNQGAQQMTSDSLRLYPNLRLDQPVRPRDKLSSNPLFSFSPEDESRIFLQRSSAR